VAEDVILVTGATGTQGGATIDALLAGGFRARALVRDLGSPAAQELDRRGVTLFKGDFDDDASVAGAVRGASGVFSMQTTPRPDDLDYELRTGERLIAAARAAEVKTFVHTSVARAGDQESFVDWASGRWSPNYWNSKSGVNEAVRSAGFSRWVILKPAFMMDNFIPPKAGWMFPGLARGTVETALRAETRLDLIAAADVGRFAAAAFEEPARFDRQEIDLAAEALTMAEVAATLAAVTGRPVEARSLSGAQARAAGNSPGLVESQQWANVEGYRVDIARANAHGIQLQRFRRWAEEHRDRFEIGGA